MCYLVAHSPGSMFLPALKTLGVTPLVGLLSVGAALFIGLFSSFVPAWSASRTSILEALKYSG
jgi:ABC-type antimicrobial peptide transport system permease subunit